MSESILLAYASRSGSTREVAEAVVEGLVASGLNCDLKQAREVHSLDSYAAVILGAPIYMFHWHPDALNFLSRLRPGLSDRPLAIFALGPFHDVEKELLDAGQQLDKDLLKYPWLKPVDIKIFAGKFDPKKMTFPFSLLMALPANPMKKIPPSDERNWPQIRAWAEATGSQLLRKYS